MNIRDPHSGRLLRSFFNPNYFLARTYHNDEARIETRRSIPELGKWELEICTSGCREGKVLVSSSFYHEVTVGDHVSVTYQVGHFTRQVKITAIAKLERGKITP
jgi:hypothetical protein